MKTETLKKIEIQKKLEAGKFKGQIPILEVIIVVIALFISFSIFFPAESFKNRWGDAATILKGRDIILTADRIIASPVGTSMLNKIAFDNQTRNDFLREVIPERNLIWWAGTEGAVQGDIIVACNCTDQQIKDLILWISRLKINERNISIDFVSSPLSPIQTSDVLLIWGNNLNLDLYKTSLVNYLKGGRGIVLMAEFDIDAADFGSKSVSVRKEIFGIDSCAPSAGTDPSCDIPPPSPDSNDDFIKPLKSTNSTYQAYKFFYHLPMHVNATFPDSTLPVEGGIGACSADPPYWQGEFGFRGNSYKFWVCSTTPPRVYLDTNTPSNGAADRIINELDRFSVSGYNFLMSYVEQNRIFISFKPTPAPYSFLNFRDMNTRLYPTDNDKSKILLHNGFYPTSARCPSNTCPIPVVVVNGTGLSPKAVWLADFTENGVTDDEKLLLASLLLSSARKKTEEVTIGNLRIGFLTSYINAVNRDMFEVYRFNLGLGFPF